MDPWLQRFEERKKSKRPLLTATKCILKNEAVQKSLTLPRTFPFLHRKSQNNMAVDSLEGTVESLAASQTKLSDWGYMYWSRSGPSSKESFRVWEANLSDRNFASQRRGTSFPDLLLKWLSMLLLTSFEACGWLLSLLWFWLGPDECYYSS